MTKQYTRFSLSFVQETLIHLGMLKTISPGGFMSPMSDLVHTATKHLMHSWHWLWVHMTDWKVLEKVSIVLGILGVPLGFLANRRQKKRRKS
jgi:hypothetical protein